MNYFLEPNNFFFILIENIFFRNSTFNIHMRSLLQKNIILISIHFFRYSVSDDNALHIKKLELEDSAMYQCLAVNEAGEKSAYTWLRVKSKYRLNILQFLDSNRLSKLNYI